MAYSLGVDLGTTFVAAALWQDARAKMSTLANRSIVSQLSCLREDNVLITGEAAARRAADRPERVVREFKRRLGDQLRYPGHSDDHRA